MAKTKLPKAPDLRNLNWYYLQKAMYAAWSLYDQPATTEEGRQRIRAVYDEYARRGVSKVIRPAPAQ